MAGRPSTAPAGTRFHRWTRRTGPGPGTKPGRGPLHLRGLLVPDAEDMAMTSLLIIVLVVLLLGGMFGGRRWYRRDRYGGWGRGRWRL